MIYIYIPLMRMENLFISFSAFCSSLRTSSFASLWHSMECTLTYMAIPAYIHTHMPSHAYIHTQLMRMGGLLISFSAFLFLFPSEPHLLRLFGNSVHVMQNVRIHMWQYIHTYTHTYIQSHAYIHTYIQLHAYIHSL